MKRLLLIALWSAACASTPKVKDEARVEEASAADGGDDAWQDARSSAGFRPLSEQQKLTAERVAREMQSINEAQAACDAEISGRLNDAQLAQLAAEREAAFVQATGPRVENAGAVKELTRIGLAVAKGTPGLRFGLTASEKPRAFSTTAGTVLVTTGLVKACANEAQLAAVLAHEAEQVRTRADEKPRVTVLRAQCLAVKLAKGDFLPRGVPGETSNPMVLELEQLSQAGALEADVAALRALSAAGYDAAEYEALVRALGDAEQVGAAMFVGAEKRALLMKAARERLQLKAGRKPPLPTAFTAL